MQQLQNNYLSELKKNILLKNELEYINELEKRLEELILIDSNKNVLTVVGCEGCGKSTILASKLDKWRNNKFENIRIIEYFAGASQENCKLFSALIFCMQRLHESFQTTMDMEPITDENQIIMMLEKLLHETADNAPNDVIVLVIDGIDAVTCGSSNTFEKLEYLVKSCPKNVRFVFSCTLNHLAMDALQNDSRRSELQEEANVDPQYMALVDLLIGPAWNVYALPSPTSTFFKNLLQSSLLEEDPIMLVQSHADGLCDKLGSIRCLHMAESSFRAIRVAATLGYDVQRLVNQILDEKIQTYADLLQHVMLPFFSRGNNPSNEDVNAAWSAVQSGVTTKPENSTDAVKADNAKETPRKSVIKSVVKLSATPDAEPLFESTPIYLLGGSVVDELYAPLCSWLGYIAASRFGSTLNELTNIQSFISRVTSTSTSSLSDPWRTTRSKSSDSHDLPEFKVNALVRIVPIFGVMQADKRMWIPASNTTAMEFVRTQIINHEDIAPAMDVVTQLAMDIERNFGKLRTQSLLSPKKGSKPSRSGTTTVNVSYEQDNMIGRWRLLLIAFHIVKKKKSTRRAEELPWLLAQNRRRAVLHSAIADINTFLGMWDDELLRFELLAYWQMLTGMHSFLVSETCNSDLDDDKHAIYDIVDSYTNSFHDFSVNLNAVAQEKENAMGNLVANIAQSIGIFLWWYGSMTSAKNIYLRPGITHSLLKELNVQFDQKTLLDAFVTVNFEPDIASLESHREIRQKLLHDLEVLVRALGEAGGTIDQLREQKTSTLRLLVDEESTYDANVDLEASRWYYFKRWFWIHFPIIVLEPNMNAIESQLENTASNASNSGQNAPINFWDKMKQDPFEVVQPRGRLQDHLKPKTNNETVSTAVLAVPESNWVAYSEKSEQRRIHSSPALIERPSVSSPGGNGNRTTLIPLGTPKGGSKTKSSQDTQLLPVANDKISSRSSSGIPQTLAAFTERVDAVGIGESEARIDEMNEMLVQYRKKLNMLKYMAQRKEQELDRTMRTVEARFEMDNNTESTMREGEATIDTLQNQLFQVQQDSAKMEMVSEYFNQIIEVCEMHPAKEEPLISALDAYIDEMEKTQIALQQRYEQVQRFHTKMDDDEKSELRATLELRIKKHQELIDRLKLRREQENAYLREKFLRTLERERIADKIRHSETSDEQEEKLWKLYHQQVIYQDLIESRKKVLNDHVGKLKQHYAQLVKKYGSDDPTEIARVIQDREDQKRSLRKRVKYLKAQLAKKQDQADILRDSMGYGVQYPAVLATLRSRLATLCDQVGADVNAEDDSLVSITTQLSTTIQIHRMEETKITDEQ